MIKLSSKITAIAGILVAFIPFYFAVGSIVLQQLNRWEMMEQLEKQRLQTVSLTSNDKFNWEEEGKEININGEMFDVDSYQYNNGNLVVVGIFDHQEDQIHKDVADFFSKNQHNKTTQTLGAQQIIFQLLFKDDIKTTINAPGIVDASDIYNLYQSSGLLKVSLDIQIPPPRTIS